MSEPKRKRITMNYIDDIIDLENMSDIKQENSVLDDTQNMHSNKNDVQNMHSVIKQENSEGTQNMYSDKNDVQYMHPVMKQENYSEGTQYCQLHHKELR